MTMRYSTIDQLQTLVPLAQDRELWKILTLKLTCFSVWVCSLPRKKKTSKSTGVIMNLCSLSRASKKNHQREAPGMKSIREKDHQRQKKCCSKTNMLQDVFLRKYVWSCSGVVKLCWCVAEVSSNVVDLGVILKVTRPCLKSIVRCNLSDTNRDVVSLLYTFFPRCCLLDFVRL